MFLSVIYLKEFSFKKRCLKTALKLKQQGYSDDLSTLQEIENHRGWKGP